MSAASNLPKVSTTQERGQACIDEDFLSNISVVDIEYMLVKQAPKAKDEKETNKKKKKTVTSTEDSYDPLADKDDKLLDEETDRGQFALNPSFGDLIVDKRVDSNDSSWKFVLVNKDEVGMPLIFRIRAQVPSRPVTPPVQVGDALCLDTSIEEAQAGLARTSKGRAKHPLPADPQDQQENNGEPSAKRRSLDDPQLSMKQQETSTSSQGGFWSDSGPGSAGNAVGYPSPLSNGGNGASSVTLSPQCHISHDGEIVAEGEVAESSQEGEQQGRVRDKREEAVLTFSIPPPLILLQYEPASIVLSSALRSQSVGSDPLPTPKWLHSESL
ncbi:hypothetical protein JCM11641_006200 [Rhodosporidiobolus odoratus]